MIDYTEDPFESENDRWFKKQQTALEGEMLQKVRGVLEKHVAADALPQVVHDVMQVAMAHAGTLLNRDDQRRVRNKKQQRPDQDPK